MAFARLLIAGFHTLANRVDRATANTGSAFASGNLQAPGKRIVAARTRRERNAIADF
jgi:hypothetical protein